MFKSLKLPARRPAAVSFLAAMLLGAPAAYAQWSGSAGVVSDYLYRGVSLSSGRPAPRVALNYDADSGWYGGAQVVSAQLAGATGRGAQWLAYGGYAERLPSGLSWEAGVSRYTFRQLPRWRFNEVHGGVAFGNAGARLYYSPDYLGMGTRTWYGELNGGWELAGGLGAFWHAGYLGSVRAAPGAVIGRHDARVGVQAAVDGWRAELSLNMARKRRTGGAYYTDERRTTRDVVLSIGRAF